MLAVVLGLPITARTVPSGVPYKPSFSCSGSCQARKLQVSSKRGAVLLPGGGISGPLSGVSMEKRAESEDGYWDILPSTNKAGSPPLPDPNTLGATPTAPQYLYVGASTSATNFPIGLFSSYIVKQGTNRNLQPMEPSISNHGPVIQMPVGRSRWILGSGRPRFKFQLPSLTCFVTLN